MGDFDAEKARTEAAGIGASWDMLDISEESSVVEAVGKIAQRDGLLGLVNIAGVHKNVSVVASSAADWDRIHSVNARGTFLMCREAARHILKQGSASIITRVHFGNLRRLHVIEVCCTRAHPVPGRGSGEGRNQGERYIARTCRYRNAAAL